MRAALLRRPELWLALAIAALLVAPNIHWNLANGLATFRHTGDNIEGSGHQAQSAACRSNSSRSQFAVLGPDPVRRPARRIGAHRVARHQPRRPADARLCHPAARPHHRHRHRDAAPSPTGRRPRSSQGSWWSVALLVRHGAWKWLAASLAIGVAAQAAFLAGDARATQINVPWLGDVYRRTLGWRALGEETGRLARQARRPHHRRRPARRHRLPPLLLARSAGAGLRLAAGGDARPSFRSDPRADRRGRRCRSCSSAAARRTSASRRQFAVGSAAGLVRGADRPDVEPHVSTCSGRRTARPDPPDRPVPMMSRSAMTVPVDLGPVRRARARRLCARDPRIHPQPAGKLARLSHVHAVSPSGDRLAERAAGRYGAMERAHAALSEPQQLRKERPVHAADRSTSLERDVLAAAIDRMRQPGQAPSRSSISAPMSGSIRCSSRAAAGRTRACWRRSRSPASSSASASTCASNPGFDITVLPAGGDGSRRRGRAGDLRARSRRHVMSTGATARANDGETVRVRAGRCSAIVAEAGISAIDALKIDIEGAEDLALAPFLRDAPSDVAAAPRADRGTARLGRSISTRCCASAATFGRSAAGTILCFGLP